MFTMIKLVSRHQNTHQYRVIFHVELMNEAIRNLESYKEYYAIALGAKPPKTKASIRKKQSSSDTTMPPPTATGKRLKTSAKIKLATKKSLTQTNISHASESGAHEGTGIIPWVPDVPTYESDDAEISWKSSEDDDDNDDEKISEHDDDVDDQSNDDDQDDDDDEQTNSDTDVQRPSQVKNMDDEDNDEDSHGMNVERDEGANEKDESNEFYRDVNINLAGQDVQMAGVQTTQVIKYTHVTLTPVNPEGQQQSSSMSSRFVSNMLNPSPDTAFHNKLDENIQKIIKKQVKEQVKVQVSKILPKIKETVNEQLEAEVLTRSSNLSKTSHAVVVDLFELELKKILIEKMESNKSIHISDEQKNLYKALVDSYKYDKLILNTYRDTVTLKRSRDDEDKNEEPFARSNQGSKRRREGKEPESTNAPKEKTSKTSGKSTEGSKSHHKTASESAPAEEPIHTTQDLEEPAPQEFETGATDDQHVEEASQHPHWFQKQAKPPTFNRAWNKNFSTTHEHIQPWISNLENKADSRT
nr:hypothetical protein [Tanacetum cinerariifolium]